MARTNNNFLRRARGMSQDRADLTTTRGVANNGTTQTTQSASRGALIPERNNFDDWSSSSDSTSKINWAQTYSSDEESQKVERRTQLRRSGSVPSLIENMAEQTTVWNVSSPHHRRTRSRTVAWEEDEISVSEDEDSGVVSDTDERRKASIPRRDFGSVVRSVALCTPVKWLYVLFLLTCYTTFWLPYPALRPQVPVIVPTVNETVVLAIRSSSSPVAMYHARAAPEMELNYKPGLDRYYEQEGFSSHAWTKYANLWALGTVMMFIYREHRRREESIPGNSIVSSIFFLC